MVSLRPAIIIQHHLPRLTESKTLEHNPAYPESSSQSPFHTPFSSYATPPYSSPSDQAVLRVRPLQHLHRFSKHRRPSPATWPTTAFLPQTPPLTSALIVARARNPRASALWSILGGLHFGSAATAGTSTTGHYALRSAITVHI